MLNSRVVLELLHVSYVELVSCDGLVSWVSYDDADVSFVGSELMLEVEVVVV